MKLTKNQLRKIIQEQVETAEAEEEARRAIAKAGDDLAQTAGLDALEKEGGAMSPEDLEDEMASAGQSAGIEDPEGTARKALKSLEDEQIVKHHSHGDVVNVHTMGESNIRIKRSRLAQLIREELMRKK